MKTEFRKSFNTFPFIFNQKWEGIFIVESVASLFTREKSCHGNWPILEYLEILKDGLWKLPPPFH